MEYATAQPNDAAEIERLFVWTFTDSEGQSEGEMIGRLAGDLLNRTSESDRYCFVAREDGQIVGSIFFSRITLECEVKAFILSPVAVRTDHQGKGIGQRLITFGLDVLTDDGVELAITYGDLNFYSKVGFHPVTEAVVPAPLTLQYPEGWLAQSLKSDSIPPIGGKSRCVEALNRAEYW
jgi:putative acetyltransferase